MFPPVSFLSLFLGKRQGKPPKKQGFYIPTEPLKSLGKKGKTLKKTRKSSQEEKTRKSQKTRKGRSGPERKLEGSLPGSPRGAPPAPLPALPQHPDFPRQSPQQSPQQFWGIGPRWSSGWSARSQLFCLLSTMILKNLSSPHRGIAIAVMLASWSTSQWISAVRAQIAGKCIASQRRFSATHIALHKSLALVQSKALKSRDSHRGLLKYIASQTCIARFGELGKKLGKEKTNKHKDFWRDTPWCASLSRGHVPSVPRYVPSVPGTFCAFSIDLHINQAQMSHVSLGRPEFVPGTPPGHPTAKFLYVIFLYRFCLSIKTQRSEGS